jgi:vesicle coat complex subunit
VLDFFSPRVARLRRKHDVAGLIDVLESGRPRVRRAAANALVLMPDARALDPLLNALRDADPLVRVNAALALGEFTGTRPQLSSIAESLIVTLDDDLDPVRAMAASALGRLKDPRAVEPLIGLLDDGSDVVRKTAVAVLRSFDDTRAREALARGSA